MGMIIGPTPWWQSNLVRFCAVGCPLPDGSRIVCKAGGTAWIVAPASTQVNSNWANVSIVGTGSTTGDLPSISCWATLCSQLLNCGFNPADWFVPSLTQLQNPGLVCKTIWDYNSPCYWSSTEVPSSATTAYSACCLQCNNSTTSSLKSSTNSVRAFRCVTY